MARKQAAPASRAFGKGCLCCINARISSLTFVGLGLGYGENWLKKRREQKAEGLDVRKNTMNFRTNSKSSNTGTVLQRTNCAHF